MRTIRYVKGSFFLAIFLSTPTLVMPQDTAEALKSYCSFVFINGDADKFRRCLSGFAVSPAKMRSLVSLWRTRFPAKEPSIYIGFSVRCLQIITGQDCFESAFCPGSRTKSGVFSKPAGSDFCDPRRQRDEHGEQKSQAPARRVVLGSGNPPRSHLHKSSSVGCSSSMQEPHVPLPLAGDGEFDR